MLAQTVGPITIVIVVLYLMIVGYLGWLGYRRTKGAADYMLAGRKVHPFIMAMSYGATFISTSAIVGFGGVAGLFGMSLLWLTFLNIFVGIFIAFVFLGGPTRRMGHRLDAHTFPELLGRRFRSKFVQVFAGLVIFLFIPLYAAAVLVGGCEFIAERFGIDYSTALLLFSVIIALYVVVGGLKGVMYTDALQGTLMFVGMVVLLVATYVMLGGVTEAHEGLAEMKDQAFVGFRAIGHKGWTEMPPFGWGADEAGKPVHNLWWIVISTITLGVGIGVLAQPQLAVRFMTVKSKRELNRAVLVGGVFILIMTGVAFTVGSLSNLWFYENETVEGIIVRKTETKVVAKDMRREELRKDVLCELWHIDVDDDGEADVHIVGRGLGKAAAIMPKAEVEELDNGKALVRPRATSFTRGVAEMEGTKKWKFNDGRVIPTYVIRAMPAWFGTLFLLTLLAAAMSTLSSQFHAVGTSIGRDVFEQLSGRKKDAGADRGVHVVRIGIIIGIIVAAVISYYTRGGYFIARATAIFFGLCASAFLPTFLGGLFWKRMTRAGAIASMVSGFLVTGFWLMLVKAKEADAIGLVYRLTEGKASILGGTWAVVDPIVVALPISIVVAVVVSLATRPPKKEHLDTCFGRKA